MSTLISPRRFRYMALLALPFAFACTEKAPPPAKTDSVAVAPAPKPTQAPDSFRVAFETTKGTFVVQVNRALAPIGADRFYELVQSGYFTDVRFFRVIKGFMAQFGMHGDPKTNGDWQFKALPDEQPKEGNKRGTIVYANAGPNTRSNQFFINFADNDMLDSGQPGPFTPFGHVVEGMDVVDKINSQYGEQPDQGRIAAEGNAYLSKAFPKLDYIKSAKVM